VFDSIGWGEIFVVILAGLIIIGPERLPGVIMDVRAALFAARRAINEAKDELYGEEFDELRKPMSTVTEYAAMGPKRAIAKVLFDEDGDYLDQFDPRRMMDGDPVVGNRNRPAEAAGAAKAAAGGAAKAAAGGAAKAAAGGAGNVAGQAAQSRVASETALFRQTENPAESAQVRMPEQTASTAPSGPSSPTSPNSGTSGVGEDAVPRPSRRRRRQPGIQPAPSQSTPTDRSSGGGFSWADVT